MASGRTGSHPPHVVLIPLPIHGHLHPFLHLSLRLASLGSIITFITTNSTRAAAISAMELFSGGDESSRQAIRFLVLGDGDRSQGYGLKDSVEFMVRNLDDIEQLLVSSTREFGRVSLGIIDFIVFDQLRNLASLQGSVTAAFWTSSAAMLQIAASMETLLEREFLPLSKNNEKRVVDSSVVPGVPCELSIFTDIPEDPLDPTFTSTRKITKSLLTASKVLVNTFDDLEEQSLRSLREQGFDNLVNVGPLLRLQPEASITNTPDETRQWLDTQETSSVLLVSFGTMLELPEEQLVEIGYGLEASQQSFLWVLRQTSQQKVAKFLDGLRKRIRTRGLILSWIPQLEILGHPSVGGFLTHGGWNSTLESLSCGVPMIGWPIMGDQTINCKFMADVWRVGLRIQSKDSSDGSIRLVRREEIEKAVRTLIKGDGGSSMRRRTILLQSKVDEGIKLACIRLHELRQA